MENDRTALDIVLELIEDGTLTAFDAKILIQAINKQSGTQVVPMPYKEYTSPDWTYYPYKPNQPWFVSSTSTDTNYENNDTIDG